MFSHRLTSLKSITTNFSLPVNTSYRLLCSVRFATTMSNPQNMYSGLKRSTHINGTSLTSDGTSNKKINAWQSPGPAAFDFRSDTITTPTASMLEAITHTTLFDDVYLEDTTTSNLEAYIAQLTSHEAGLLVMSGTMGNQVALRSHLTHPPHSILCDVRSHIFRYEAGGASTLSGAMVIQVSPSNNHHLTLEDIQKHVVIDDDPHACPTSVIALENTLNGMIMPLSEVKRISAFARSNNIKLHLDGARIWEVVASDFPDSGSTLSDYTSLFDSVSLCFSKGLGAPIGSMLVGSHTFIKQSRRIRKMMGGGTRQAGLLAAPAMTAVMETFGTDGSGTGGKLHQTHIRAKKIAKHWTDLGGILTWPVETNMVWIDLDAAGCSAEDFAQLGETYGLILTRGRLVIHYQICEEAIGNLQKVMDEVMKGRSGKNGVHRTA